jgi:hypothetical protein
LSSSHDNCYNKRNEVDDLTKEEDKNMKVVENSTVYASDPYCHSDELVASKVKFLKVTFMADQLCET